MKYVDKIRKIIRLDTRPSQPNCYVKIKCSSGSLLLLNSHGLRSEKRDGPLEEKREKLLFFFKFKF